MIGYYRLDGHKPVACKDMMEWARWSSQQPPEWSRVAGTKAEGIFVSTVFLGIDHNWTGHGPPIVFETMAFNAPDDDDRMRRYATWDEAEAGHWEVVRDIERLLNSDGLPDLTPDDETDV